MDEWDFMALLLIVVVIAAGLCAWYAIGLSLVQG